MYIGHSYDMLYLKGKDGEPMRGLIHIYCGDGKGKTSAAVGLAVRAAGNHMKILVMRFLKTDDSGEVLILKKIPGIHVMPCDREFGFTFCMSDDVRMEASEYYNERLRAVIQMSEQESYDVLILDEIMSAYREGMVEREVLIEFLKHKPDSLEVILTGRNPDEELVELADYVSEINKVKHPFDQGIPARNGIEM